jgi:hypothetical protein
MAASATDKVFDELGKMTVLEKMGARGHPGRDESGHDASGVFRPRRDAELMSTTNSRR